MVTRTADGGDVNPVAHLDAEIGFAGGNENAIGRILHEQVEGGGIPIGDLGTDLDWNAPGGLGFGEGPCPGEDRDGVGGGVGEGGGGEEEQEDQGRETGRRATGRAGLMLGQGHPGCDGGSWRVRFRPCGNRIAQRG